MSFWEHKTHICVLYGGLFHNSEQILSELIFSIIFSHAYRH